MIDPVALTVKSIQCQSVTPADDGAQQVLIDALAPLGFTAVKLRFGDIENFVAHIGAGSPHLCYCGHTDVVPAGDDGAVWTDPPFAGTVRDGKIYGRGASDMKGSNAAFCAAVERFLQKKPDFKGRISILISGDEEAKAVEGTAKVIHWMDNNNLRPDVCLVGEPSNFKQLGETLRIGRRGSFSATLTVRGTQGHVAYPERNHNPIPVLIKMLQRLVDISFDAGDDLFPPTRLNVTAIETGNPAFNVIPGAVRANFNIRFSSQWKSAALEERIRAVLDAENHAYELRVLPSAESFLTKPGAWTALVRDAVAAITGRMPAYNAGGGTSDARFIAPYCDVVEFGPLNATIHQVDEHIALSDLAQLTEIYERVLDDYFK